MQESEVKNCPEGFHGKFIVHESGCWLWTGARNKRGYGNFRSKSAHRISYEYYIGKIPKEMTIDHICRVVNCINPNHLRIMSMYDNNMIGNSVTALNKRKTTCKYGHPLSGDNIIIKKRKDGTRRICRICHRTYKLKSYYTVKNRNLARQALESVKGGK